MDFGQAPRMIRFGHCTLDEGRGVLIAPDGSETPLRPKTHELLRLLLKHPGRVVPRAEILDSVWPGIFVTDDSITQCVVELRKAMGPGGAALLRTLPRRGYLLQADVIAEMLPEPAPAGRSDDRPSIAVLPFRKERGDPQEAYFEDGIIEGIVHVLSGLERILVISRGSALAVAEQTTDPREVGKRLSVRYVLHGGVRRAGERLRITTELSEAETGAILRTDKYDGDVGDVFALQDRIAEAAVAVIAPQVRERELARALRKPPSSLTAYDLVLRALSEMRRMDRGAMEVARAHLRQAIAVEPDHALAYSYLGWWYVFWLAQGWSADWSSDTHAAAEAASAALERDRNDGLAMTVRGLMLSYVERAFEPARRLLDQAVAASPSCALAWSCGAALRCWVDEPQEAVAWAERAVRLAPRDPFSFLHEHILSQAHYAAGNYEDAIAWGRASAFSNPLHVPSWRTLIASLVAVGRLSDAQEPCRRVLALEPDFSLKRLAERTPLNEKARDAFVEHLRRAGLPD
jgi:TolB-like protein/Tfp pilus assembly protein PilF